MKMTLEMVMTQEQTLTRFGFGVYDGTTKNRVHEKMGISPVNSDGCERVRRGCRGKNRLIP
jgi:hypothetical protein